VAHLDHDDAVLVIAGDAPAAALTFGHGPAPFRGSDAGACDEADLGQRVATAHLQRIPAQEHARRNVPRAIMPDYSAFGWLKPGEVDTGWRMCPRSELGYMYS
jgi:hypothetical protein